jgi:membrane protease YdiL (CAAX protease family)
VPSPPLATAPADALPPERTSALLATWATAVAGIALARVLALADPTGLLGANLAGVAAFLFIWLPDRRLRARGEGWGGYGAPAHRLSDRRAWRELARGAGQGALACAVIFPPFALAFWGFAASLPLLPPGLAGWLAPYLGAPRLAPRLPGGLPLLAAVQLLVVALPEELFYRGWLQTSLARAAPSRGVTVLGARLGSGFLLTQLLFAAGHLVTLQPWRLGTLFPGLLFGWLRERTGGLAAPVVAHALSNLLMTTLERSFYG